MSRKTPEERLADLQEQQEQLKARISREKARIASQKRKDDTRRKIIIGGAVMAHAKNNEEFDKAIADLLDKYVPADRDRKLLGLAPRESKAP